MDYYSMIERLNERLLDNKSTHGGFPPTGVASISPAWQNDPTGIFKMVGRQLVDLYGPLDPELNQELNPSSPKFNMV